MKTDWDVIRGILMEVESLSPDTGICIEYTINGADSYKATQAFFVWKSGLIHGVKVLSCEGESMIAYDLTREGREVLGSMRSKPIWEQTKTLAREKSVQLTTTSIRQFSTFALVNLFGASKETRPSFNYGVSGV